MFLRILVIALLMHCCVVPVALAADTAPSCSSIRRALLQLQSFGASQKTKDRRLLQAVLDADCCDVEFWLKKGADVDQNKAALIEAVNSDRFGKSRVPSPAERQATMHLLRSYSKSK